MIDLSGIISINGMAGLHKVLTQTKNGVIVESMQDKKRFPVFGSNKVSALEDISMFTTDEDKSLTDIMTTIFEKEKGGKCEDHKADDKAIIAYFEIILPDYDKERVYTSNMRKLFSWYNILQETGNLKEKSEETAEEKTSKSIEDPLKKVAAKTSMKDLNRSAKQSSAGHTKTAGVRKSGLA